MDLIQHITKFHFYRPMSSPICLLYRVIQDFVQKALFSEIKTIRSGWYNYA